MHRGVYVDSSGTRGIRFDGSAINNGTIIYVAQKKYGDKNGTILMATDDDHYLIGAYEKRSRALRIGNNPSHYYNSPSTSNYNTTPHIYEYTEQSDNTYTFYDNGKLVSQGNTDGIDGKIRGTNDLSASTAQSDHIISEFLVFDHPLTQTERQDIE